MNKDWIFKPSKKYLKAQENRYKSGPCDYSALYFKPSEAFNISSEELLFS